MSDEKIVLEDPGSLEAPASRNETKTLIAAHLRLHKIEVNSKHTRVSDISPRLAKTRREVARLKYTVPAREKTKQARERKQQIWGKWAILGAVVVFAAYEMAQFPSAAVPIGGMITVLVGGAALLEKIDKLQFWKKD